MSTETTAAAAISKSAVSGSYSRPATGVALLLAVAPFTAIGGAGAFALAVALAGMVAAPWDRARDAIPEGRLTLWLSAAFLVWTGTSLAWSSVAAWLTFAQFAATAVGAGLVVFAARALVPADRELIRRAALACVALLFLMSALDFGLGFPIGYALEPPSKFQIPNFARMADDALCVLSVSAVCVWGCVPLFAARLRVQTLLPVAVCIAAGLGAGAASGGEKAVLALAIAAAPAALAYVWPRRTILLLAQAIAIWFVAAPLVMPWVTAEWIKLFAATIPKGEQFAWLARLGSWKIIAAEIGSRAVWGWGFGSSAHFDETYRVSNFVMLAVPRHLRNAPQQLWLETGAIGVMLAAGAIASFGRRVSAALAKDKWAASAAAGAIATAAILANIAAGAWSPWWWAAVAASAAIIRAAQKDVNEVNAARQGAEG